MNEQPRRPLGPQPWDVVRNKLDQSLPFANMRDTPYYRDCVWEQFSAGEYKRRYESLRAKMREHKLDAVVVPGGPSHWSFGAGMTWLTGHWEWHALCCYVLVPRDGEPTMIYSMGGTHAEAVRRHVEVAVKDVRHSRNGQYAMVMVERLRELKLEKGRIGLMEIDPRHGDYLPVNQYNTLRQELPDAELVFTKNFLHDLVVIHSKEELDCVRKAGVLCERAMEAMVARAKPGVKEYEIKAAAASAIMDGGGDIDFLIIGSTPMDNPALIFGNPRPSSRVLKKGDMINMEIAAGYRGYTAQIGSPITLGPPTDMVRKFWEEITLPGYNKIVAEIAPGKNAKAMQEASRFFRDKGVQSRPTQCHGIDIVTDNPHVMLGPHRRHRERHDPQARHDHHGGAEPDHRRRDVRDLPRPHLHRERHRARGGGQVPAGDRGGGLTRATPTLPWERRPCDSRHVNAPLTLYAPLGRRMALTDAEDLAAPPAQAGRAARLRARARDWLNSEHGAAQRMAGMAFAIRVTSAGVTFLSQIALARWMGGFDFGIYVAVWTWLVLAGDIVHLGVPLIAQRYIPEYTHHNQFDALRGFLIGSRWITFGLATAFALIGAGAIFALTPWLDPHTVLPFYLACVSLPFFTVSLMCDGLARSYNWIVLALGPHTLLRPVVLFALMALAYAAGFPIDATTTMIALTLAIWSTSLLQLVLVDRRLEGRGAGGPRQYEVRRWFATVAADHPGVVVLHHALLRRRAGAAAVPAAAGGRRTTTRP